MGRKIKDQAKYDERQRKAKERLDKLAVEGETEKYEEKIKE